MRTVSATAASRAFSELLDSVARGDVVTITRGGHPIAEVRPVRRYTVRGLRKALAGAPPLDPAFESDVAGALAMVEAEEIGDPWAGA